MGSFFTKRNFKFGIFIISGLSAVLLSIYILLVLNISYQTKALATSDNLNEDLLEWSKKIEFLKILPDSKNENYKDSYSMKALDSYILNYSRFNDLSLIKLPQMEMLDYNEIQMVDIENNINHDDKFFDDLKYIYTSDNISYSVHSYFRLKIDQKESNQVDIVLRQNNIGNYKTEVTGSLEKDKVVDIIINNFKLLLDQTTDNEVQQIMKIPNIQEKFSSLIPGSFDLLILENEGVLNVGKLNLEQKESQFSTFIDVAYDRDLREYKFLNIFSTLSLIPEIKKKVISIPTPADIEIINCLDCFLAPVDKYHSLPSSYAPSVTNVTLSGGGLLTNNTLSALKDLNSDASNKGISITVISTYRSYQTQITTFNYWVEQHKKKGLSQTQAEIQANRISARAGQSEHQLGTAVDLKCSSCGNFDNSASNLTLYKYLEENAHKYGFVISYPKGKELITGYSYEPWHIRYIGIDLATEFFNKNYLTEPNLSSTILLAQR